MSGRVDKQSIGELTKTQVHVSLVHVYFRTQVEVSTERVASFTIAGSKNAAAWIDSQSVAVQSDAPKAMQTFEAKLSPGKHTVLLRLDARDLPESFTLKSADVSFAVE